MTTKLSQSYRWRKATDVSREHALFELLESGVPLLDLGFSDKGVFEVTFNPSMAMKSIEWELLLKLINEGKALAVIDRN